MPFASKSCDQRTQAGWAASIPASIGVRRAGGACLRARLGGSCCAATVTLPRKPDLQTEAIDAGEELPVVARMVVEIRSDGSRTVARGAIEDNLGGQRVGVEARADSPLELSRALAKMVLSAPFAALLGTQLGRDELGDNKGDAQSRSSGIRGTVGALGRGLGRRLRRIGGKP